MNLKFRKMIQDDITQVYNIEKILFSDPWSMNSFVDDLKGNQFSYSFIIENDNEVVGYSVCWYYLNELHIGNFAIHPDYQRKGLGKFFLKNIFKKFNKYHIAYLEVRENNLAAINLYSKFGFKEMYRRKKYYSNGEDAMVMVKFRK